jgi:hypothetical protein
MFGSFAHATFLYTALAAVPVIAAPPAAELPKKQAFSSAHLVAPILSEVTREMQLADLSKDPAMVGALRQAGAEKPAPKPLDPSSPWAKGVVISPLSPIWPAGANFQAAGVFMTSYTIHLSPWYPLPTQGKDYVLMISVNDPNHAFFELDIRWPVAGHYLVSVNAADISPNVVGRPRFGPATPSAPKVIMSPNDPAKPTRWTTLVTVPANEVGFPGGLYRFFPSNPASVSGGFIQPLIGKITFRKL